MAAKPASKPADPLKNSDMLKQLATEQAEVLTTSSRPVTAMEFCRMVIQERMGLQDYGVGSRQRITISEVRKEVLGDDKDRKFIIQPGPPVDVNVPCFHECVKTIVQETNHGGDGDLKNRSHVPSIADTETLNVRLLHQFDPRKLIDDGIVHLPGILTTTECSHLLQQLSQAFHRNGRSKQYLLRKSTGNGMNGSYETIQHTPELLDDLVTALSQILLQDKLLNVRNVGRRSLLLLYGDGGVNWAHQDQHFYPYQALLLLSRPGVDFTGGQLYVSEPTVDQQGRIRATSNQVDLCTIGDVVIFAANNETGRGWYHGMKEVRPGSTGNGLCNRIAIGLLHFDRKQLRQGKKTKDKGS